MKVELEELERKARAANHRVKVVAPWWAEDSAHLASSGVSPEDRALIAAASPDVVLAIAARIRELEAGINETIDVATRRLLWDHEIAALRALVAKGVVLP